MSLLPPDPSRLRAILAHLDRQITENETVGIYLRLQRDAVREALARTERGPRQRGPRVRDGTTLPGFALPPPKAGYVVQQKRTPNGPEPALIHLTGCTMTEGSVHPVRADEARAALTDPNVTACHFCRPDSELGIDLA
ncbi:DUF6233 domain-containing protein [Streptomyces sp. NPDC003710]